MAERESIRTIFLEEFEALLRATGAGFEELNPAKFDHLLEIVRERHGRLEPAGYLHAGYSLTILDVMDRLGTGEELIDRVLERVRGLLN